jgi:2-heptyl-3-hydroxy-4(1H)-quinolone synthase
MICINGAGIAGLTLANGLQRLGIEYCLIEQAEQLEAIGAGILMQHNGLSILNALELDQYVDKQPISQIEVGKPNFTQTIKLKNQPAQVIHRGQLQRLLLKNIPANKIKLNCRIEKAEQTASKVKVHLNNGQTLSCDYLIEAAGIHANLHQPSCNENKTGTLQFSEQWCWRSIITTHKTKDAKQKLVAAEYWCGLYRLGLMPINANQYYCFQVRSEHSEHDNKTDLEEQRMAWLTQQLAQQNLPLLNNFDQKSLTSATWLSHGLYQKEIHWGQGRIIAIGDAAHAMTPNTGQGAVLAMEDAYELTTMIHTERQKRRNTEYTKADNLLKAFTKLRHKRCVNTQKQAWVLGKVAHLQNPALRWLRDVFMRVIPPRLAQKNQTVWLNQFIKRMKPLPPLEKYRQ